MPQNIQHKIIQTSLKHYNKLRIFRIEALLCLQFTTNLGEKLTYTKHIYQGLLDFFTIEMTKVEKYSSLEHNIIT